MVFVVAAEAFAFGASGSGDVFSAPSSLRCCGVACPSGGRGSLKVGEGGGENREHSRIRLQ